MRVELFQPGRAQMAETIREQAREIEALRRDLSHAKASCHQAWEVVRLLSDTLPTTVARAVLTTLAQP